MKCIKDDTCLRFIEALSGWKVPKINESIPPPFHLNKGQAGKVYFRNEKPFQAQMSVEPTFAWLFTSCLKIVIIRVLSKSNRHPYIKRQILHSIERVTFFSVRNISLIILRPPMQVKQKKPLSLLRKLRCWWQICYSWSSIYQGFNLQQHIESHLRDNVGFPYSHPYIGLPWLASITQKRLKKSSTHRFSFST